MSRFTSTTDELALFVLVSLHSLPPHLLCLFVHQRFGQCLHFYPTSPTVCTENLDSPTVLVSFPFMYAPSTLTLISHSIPFVCLCSCQHSVFAVYIHKCHFELSFSSRRTCEKKDRKRQKSTKKISYQISDLESSCLPRDHTNSRN